ncbi:hypothetical protein EZV62_014288 [Acer yangbiense]|uniref:Uncharacterized protein n=1 Tax=Acer yangbiense TaxID=1000413 RepID=A0A5C7HS94_9ROSI|nr:hypothetical protein EZV62_014288 [Acer yangbiense]
MNSLKYQQTDGVSHALAVADALGKTSKSKKSGAGFDDIADGLRELDMDNYDDEDEGIELFSKGNGDLYYASNQMDPYLKDEDDEDSEELEDMNINPDDAVIICARNEDDVYIYEESNDGDPNLYVHHHIIIPAFPLCTTWLDCPLKGGEKGNFIAVGSMEPSIEIWDLDIIDEVQPCVVQAVAWNHHAPQVLLSGSFDHSVVLKDARISTHSGFKWSVTADVESLAWDPHTEHSYVVSLEDGTVKGFDIRTAKSDPTSESPASFTLHAHDKAVCSLLATGSTDKTVKLWDLSNNQPSCVGSSNPKAGGVFSVSFSEDSPFLLAIGGSKGKLQVWDVLSDAGVSQRFSKYRKPNRPQPPPS